MPFLWVEIDDPPGPKSLRGYIERNAIGLLSNASAKQSIDPPSESWLGNWADNEYIRRSGLWNVNHVMDSYNRTFLKVLNEQVKQRKR